jgi:hypothetical protein
MATMLAQAACAADAAQPGRVQLAVPRSGSGSAGDKADIDQLDIITIDLPSSSLNLYSSSSGSADSDERFLQPIIDVLTHVAPVYQSPQKSGVVLFLYSVMLSRGLPAIERERDHESLSLIAAYGYCAQEAVNMMLCGRAHSNVFDGVQQVDDGAMTLRGVPERSQIGFLALAEARGDLRVGEHLKSPHWPIWVIFAESHYSVLFALDPALSISGSVPRLPFDLFFYDELANQDEEIRLTVDSQTPTRDKDTDMISYLDICIRTRWPRASVSWNGVTPLL